MQTRASVDLSRKVYLALQTVSVDLLAVLAKVRNGKKRATDSAASVCVSFHFYLLALTVLKY